MIEFAERMEQIDARLVEIRSAADTSDDIIALEAEADALIEERKEMQSKIETRKKLLKKVASSPAEIAERSPEQRKDSKMTEFENMIPSEVRGTEVYRTAFLKRLQGRDLNDLEKRANEMGSTDVAGVIPTVTQSKIFDKLTQYAPLLSEITLLQVPGNITFAVEATNAAAALHTQNAAITPAADTMASVTLAGFEIVKVLRISKTVAAMAIDAFEGWLVGYLARGIAAKIGAYIIYGSGSSQPKGIDYATTWSDTSNAVQWAGSNPTPAELVELVGYLKGGYHRNAKFLMNSKTFWANIVAVQDNSKYKILTDDYSRILGYPVLLDDNCADGDIFFGDFSFVVGNMSQGVTVERSMDSGFLYNAVDFRGSALFDCDLAVDEFCVKSAAALTAGA